MTGGATSNLYRVRIVGVRGFDLYGTRRDAEALALALAKGHPAQWIDAQSADTGEVVARIEPRTVAVAPADGPPADQPALDLAEGGNA